jgi:hypothetical protein
MEAELLLGRDSGLLEFRAIRLQKLPGNSFLPMAIPTLAPSRGSQLSPLVSVDIFWNGACNMYEQTKWRAIGTL